MRIEGLQKFEILAETKPAGGKNCPGLRPEYGLLSDERALSSTVGSYAASGSPWMPREKENEKEEILSLLGRSQNFGG